MPSLQPGVSWTPTASVTVTFEYGLTRIQVHTCSANAQYVDSQPMGAEDA